jgi:hypothetical protein
MGNKRGTLSHSNHTKSGVQRMELLQKMLVFDSGIDVISMG